MQDESSVRAHRSGIGERGPYGHMQFVTAKWFALTGGLIFTGLVIMSIISIVGRKLFSAPVPVDVEVLQMFAAFVSAAFFAYCHLMRGDIKVISVRPKLAARTLDFKGAQNEAQTLLRHK